MSFGVGKYSFGRISKSLPAVFEQVALKPGLRLTYMTTCIENNRDKNALIKSVI